MTIVIERKEQVMDLNRDEQSLLLYLHHCAVNWGQVDSRKMNEEDFKTAKNFERHKLLTFKRKKFADITGNNTHLVWLTEKGFDTANHYHKTRQTRWIKKMKEDGKWTYE
jgi:hypothetical protein